MIFQEVSLEDLPGDGQILGVADLVLLREISLHLQISLLGVMVVLGGAG